MSFLSRSSVVEHRWTGVTLVLRAPWVERLPQPAFLVGVSAQRASFEKVQLTAAVPVVGEGWREHARLPGS